MRRSVILVVDPGLALGQALKAGLHSDRFEVLESGRVDDALARMQTCAADAVIVGSSREPGWDRVAAARHFRREHAHLPIILIAAESSEDMVINALRAGVTDYLRAPVTPDELLASVEACLPSPRAQQAGPCAGSLNPILGGSRALEQVRQAIARVAATNTNVLITGETGTGKELVARLIHASGRRRKGPLLCLNCAAIPDGLLESELFGYERGAFTGANARYEGKFALAEGGTIFFDEIGDMSPYAQAKILRIIETREVDRLGGRRSVAVDVRVIAATHESLESLVSQGKFRRDLFYRLNVARIHIPPLRQRREDVAILLDHCLPEINLRLGSRITGMSMGARRCLLRYDWPGNVRELKNVLEALAVSLGEGQIHEDDLPHPCREASPPVSGPPEPSGERDRLLSALHVTNWNKSRAARQLHWSRMTLYRKIAKYHLERSETAPPAKTAAPSL